ncbi:MAG: RluA family pseudouridine synthase [Spirochaetales bacterium]|nr:RluA family pseudouridine synthase [Spirochaetales bacterium]
MESNVLFEDQDYLILCKQEYRPVQGDKSGDLSYLDELKGQGRIDPGGGLVHRLDRPVLGVLIFAKNRQSLAAFNKLLRERKVEKIYWAVTEKPPPEPEGEVIDQLGRDGRRNRSYRAAPCEREEGQSSGKTKTAVLRYRLLGKTLRYWRLEIRPLTGRSHQIRVQLAGMGCPIKGDLKYGAARSKPGGGIYLFSRSAAFVHPRTGETIRVQAPLPQDPLWAAFETPQTPEAGREKPCV